MKNIKLKNLIEHIDSISENRTFATDSLRELVDDLLLETEMLINEQYSQVTLDKFKKEWYGITKKFERKFSNILKNMSTDDNY